MALLVINGGNDIDIVYTIKDENNAVVDLTGGSIAWDLYKGGNGTSLLSKTGALTNPTGGVTTISLVPADTSSLEGLYHVQGVYTDSGAKTYTFDDGGLKVK